MSQIRIREMEKADLGATIEVHLKAFQGFFLTFLGPAFLSVLYRSLLSDPTGVAFVAEDHGQIAGFVAGTTEPNGFYQRLLRKHGWDFARAALPAFLRNPTILSRLLRAFTMPKQELPLQYCSTLMSIATAPIYQGQGIGKRLVYTFLDEVRSRGSKSVNLTTDAKDNDATNLFYCSLGFQLYHTYATPEGRRMNEYLIYLI